MTNPTAVHTTTTDATFPANASSPTQSYRKATDLPSALRRLEDPFDFPLTRADPDDHVASIDTSHPLWAEVAEMADLIEPFILGYDTVLDRPTPNPYKVHTTGSMVWAERCGGPILMTQPSLNGLNHKLIWVDSYQCRRAGQGRVLLPRWAEVLPQLAPPGVTWEVRASIPGPLMDIVAVFQDSVVEIEPVADLNPELQRAELKGRRDELLAWSESE